MSNRVRVSVDEIEGVDTGQGCAPCDGIRVTCMECDHSVDVAGRTDASIRRGCVMLREQCPQDETNFYYSADRGGGHGSSLPPDPVPRKWWDK